MKINVTVGTSAFDQLITQAERQLVGAGFDVNCQIADGQYLPNCPFFRYRDDFTGWLNQADIVITHGGAGTVFELLEAGGKLVIVPNIYRLDKHQQDLAEYIESHNYAVVCWSLDTLLSCVERGLSETFSPYQKESFFMADELLQFFGMSR